MGEDLFTREYAWGGGFYELALELPSATDTDILSTLLKLWSYPTLEGCYLHSDIEATSQKRVILDEHAEANMYINHLYGSIILPDKSKTTCLSTVIRELPLDKGGVTNWVSLNLPLGAINYSYSTGAFPFDMQDHFEWRLVIDEMLKEIGEYVYQEIRFKLGLIGMEPDTTPDYEKFIRGEIPEERYSCCLKPDGSKLLYFPANL